MEAKLIEFLKGSSKCINQHHYEQMSYVNRAVKLPYIKITACLELTVRTSNDFRSEFIIR